MIKNALQDHNGRDHRVERAAPRKNRVFTTLVADGGFFMEGPLGAFLASEGHHVIGAATAGEAVAKTGQAQPDLILLDGELEGVSGLALLNELFMAQPSAAVIVLARKPNLLEAIEAVKLGAVDYLVPPLDLKKLKAAIDIQKALFKNL